MKRKHGLIAICTFAVLLTALPLEAAAPALYWARQRVSASSVNACFGLGERVFRNLEMSYVKRLEHGVRGVKGDSSAAITCLTTGSGVAAVVMTAGPSASAKALRDRIQRELDKFTRID